MARGIAKVLGKVLGWRGVDPERVGSSRLELHGEDAGAPVLLVARLSALREGRFGGFVPRPAFSHVLAEADPDLRGLGIDADRSSHWNGSHDNGRRRTDAQLTASAAACVD